MSRPLAVFAYDFDGTLAPGNMQEHAFIPDELGMSHDDFWARDPGARPRPSAATASWPTCT